MGKNYDLELHNLDMVYESAKNADVGIIVDYLRNNIHLPIVSIGSGGSFSVSAVFDYLCLKAGGFSKCITPLELSQYHKQLLSMSAVLFSASGKNRDTLNTYQYLSEMEPEGILTCCMHTNTPIKQKQRRNLHNWYYEYEMPVQKDGYLAVESLVSTIVILCKAFMQLTQQDFYYLQESFDWSLDICDRERAKEVLSKESIIVLYNGITKPASIDLESKFSEASLGNVQLVDYRNFAHGRHFWLSNRKESTAIISMGSSSISALVNKTLRLLPKEIPCLEFNFDDSSANGLLESFKFVFSLVSIAGKIRGTNPGGPSIPEFGRRLYHMSYNICKNADMALRRRSSVDAAAFRKQKGTTYCGSIDFRKYAQQYLAEIKSKTFKGLILDFDGTIFCKDSDASIIQEVFSHLINLLDNKILIGIATGRGKSVREELRQIIPLQFWDNIVIAYYNGGCIGLLSDGAVPNKTSRSMPTALCEICKLLENNMEVKDINGFDGNPYQLTLLLGEGDRDQMIGRLTSICSCIRGAKVFQSGHSIDIVPESSSKNNILDYFEKCGYDDRSFLIIGDCGQIGGNDYEMLSRDNSLSVDHVSDDPYSCWNFAKPGLRNLEAMLFYLQHIEVSNDTFSIRGI